jgi:hypothetical protein
LAGLRNRIIVDERAVDLDPFGEEIELEGYDRNLSVTLRKQPRTYFGLAINPRAFLQSRQGTGARARFPLVLGRLG